MSGYAIAVAVMLLMFIALLIYLLQTNEEPSEPKPIAALEPDSAPIIAADSSGALIVAGDPAPEGIVEPESAPVIETELAPVVGESTPIELAPVVDIESPSAVVEPSSIEPTQAESIPAVTPETATQTDVSAESTAADGDSDPAAAGDGTD